MNEGPVRMMLDWVVTPAMPYSPFLGYRPSKVLLVEPVGLPPLPTSKWTPSAALKGVSSLYWVRLRIPQALMSRSACSPAWAMTSQVHLYFSVLPK